MIERLLWLVPLAVAGLGAWRPRAGLVAFAGALPLFGSPPGGPYLAALDVAGLAAILTAWRGGRPRPTALSWPVAAFVVVSLASLLPLTYRPPSWDPSTLLGLLSALPGVESWPALYTWRAAADLCLGWCLFLATRRAFRDHSPLPLAQALLLGLAATVVLGLADHAQIFTLEAFRPDLAYDSPSGRLDSLFFLSGWLAEYLVFAAPVAIACLYRTKGGLRWLGLPILALLIACLALTQQRGAWVAAVAQAVLWIVYSLRTGWWRRLEPRRVALVAVATIGLAGSVVVSTETSPGRLLDRARSMSTGLVGRQANWSGATELVVERPLLGWGLGSFAPAYDLVHPPGSSGASRFRLTAHSLYFNVAAERGLLGLGALILLGWGSVICLRRPRAGQEALALGLAASLIGVAVYGLVQYVYYIRNIAWLIWLLTACITLVSRCEGPIVASRWSRAVAVLALFLVPARLLLLHPPTYAGDRSFGFHEPEVRSDGTLEWTTGSAARRIPWEGENLVLSLANGHPRAAERPVTVRVGIDGETVAELKIAGGWEEHRFEVGPPQKRWLVLTLEASPTFRPFSDFRQYPDLPRSVDIRSLGVAVKGLRWENEARSSPRALPTRPLRHQLAAGGH